MSTIDLGVMQFGTLGLDGAFSWRLRHWFAVFKFPPDGTVSLGRVYFGYVIMFSLPIFWRITQPDPLSPLYRMKTSWCRPHWMLSVYRADKLYRKAQLSWIQIKQ